MPAACSVVRVRTAGAQTVRAAAVMAGAETAVAALMECPAAEYSAQALAGTAAIAAREATPAGARWHRPRRHPLRQANRAGVRAVTAHAGIARAAVMADAVKVAVAAASMAPANRAATKTRVTLD